MSEGEITPPPMDAPEPKFSDESVPNLMEHRANLREIVTRIEDVHGNP